MWGKKKAEASQPDPAERRKFIRIRSILTILARRSDQSEDFRMLTDNVSLGGVRYTTQETLTLGETLKLRMLLAQFHSQVEAEGKVAWISAAGPQRFEGGVEFTRVEEQDQQQWVRFIDAARIGDGG